jgi:hypothetical protein
MRKAMTVLTLLTVALPGTLNIAYAQDKETAPDHPKTANQESRPQSDRNNIVVTPYRLEFSFYELQDGKKINTRHFTLDLIAGSGNEIKIGTRVPVPTGKNTPDPSFNFQYMDVGTTIWANLVVLGGGDLRLDVKSDVSNLDLTGDHDRNPGLPPIVRQIQINGSTLLVTGKPILIVSMDDPNSNREFQLEVNVTKLR